MFVGLFGQIVSIEGQRFRSVLDFLYKLYYVIFLFVHHNSITVVALWYLDFQNSQIEIKNE